MLFNSLSFPIFLAVVLALYWAAPVRRRNLMLLVASYVFYGWWDWRFLGLLGISTAVDFTVGGLLGRQSDERARRALLWASLGVNLGILASFKYANFFLDSFEFSFQTIGIEVDRPTLSLVLPVGISFYTFQTISYTFDIYRRRITPARSLIDFATYVAYFPQLVAGPIERAAHLLPAIERAGERRFPRGERLTEGLNLILVGLFKKVVVADGVGTIVDEVFADPGGYSSVSIAAGILAFSIQIYGDFSGYTDIARGVSRLLGIDLVVNFKEPYLSRNVTEFWRRWHVSLSDWLRDYLYIPLGGNRNGRAATMRNLMITMLLGGLWHGAAWTFVVWGGLHGLYLVALRYFRPGAEPAGSIRIGEIGGVIATFVLISLTWVFFRADSMSSALEVFRGLSRFRTGVTDWWDILLVLTLALLTLTLDLLQRGVVSVPRSRLTAIPSGAASGGALVLLIIFSTGAARPFVYFQF